jgi:two-component system response regulator (stage 0 sporulation protein A)
MGLCFLLEVLIADNNVELCDTIAEYLNEQPDIKVVGIAYDGEEALVLIQQYKPDVLVLDVTMPRLDGIAVLEQLRAKNMAHKLVVIVLTAVSSEEVIHRFVELGADYYIVKPFDLKSLANRIRQFAEPNTVKSTIKSLPYHLGEIDTNMQITDILNWIGVPQHLKGYRYLRDAILMVLDDEQLLVTPLIKGVYANLAKRYDVTSDSVEGAIRHAIITAWDIGNREYLADLLDARDVSRFPTNALLLSKLADAVKRGDHLDKN